MSKTRPGLHRAVHSRLDHYLASLREYVKAGHCMTRASRTESVYGIYLLDLAKVEHAAEGCN
jgi:hypothetical protein